MPVNHCAAKKENTAYLYSSEVKAKPVSVEYTGLILKNGLQYFPSNNPQQNFVEVDNFKDL